MSVVPSTFSDHILTIQTKLEVFPAQKRVTIVIFYVEQFGKICKNVK